MYTLYKREVEIIEYETDLSEHFCQAIGAIWVDTGTELSDKDLDALNDKYADDFYQSAYESMADRAYDLYKDRMKYGE